MATNPPPNLNAALAGADVFLDQKLAEAQQSLKAEVGQVIQKLGQVQQGSAAYQDLEKELDALRKKNDEINVLRDELENGADPLLVYNDMGYQGLISISDEHREMLNDYIQQQYPSLPANQPTSMGQLVSLLKDEGKLRDVDKGIRDEYKSLQTQLESPDLTSNGRIQAMQRMDELKQANPALQQLDRSMLGRNLHSALRDAVQLADSVKQAIPQSVRSHISGGLDSLKQGISHLSDRIKMKECTHEMDKLVKKLGDVNQQVDQISQNKQAFERQVMMAKMVGGPGSLDPAQRQQMIQDNLKDLLGETKDLSLDALNEMVQQKLADFDDKIKDLNAKADEIKAKANKVTDQMRDLQNKKDAPQQNTAQALKQKV